jgi:MFS family permease
VAPVLAGALIARGRTDILFVAAGSIAMAVPPLIWSTTPRWAPSAGAPPGAWSHVADGIRAVLAERRILVASVAHASYFVINGTLNAFLPLFAADRVGLDAAGIGWLFGLQTVTTLAVRPLIGAASDRLGRRGVITAGLTGCAGSVLGISFSTSAAALFASVLTYAFGVAVTTAATSAYITDVAPRARFGAAHGMFGTIYDVGDASGPIVAGFLVQRWGYAATFQLMAALAGITAAAFALISSRLNHRRSPAGA